MLWLIPAERCAATDVDDHSVVLDILEQRPDWLATSLFYPRDGVLRDVGTYHCRPVYTLGAPNLLGTYELVGYLHMGICE